MPPAGPSVAVDKRATRVYYYSYFDRMGISWWSGPQRPSRGDGRAVWQNSRVNSLYLLTYAIA